MYGLLSVYQMDAKYIHLILNVILIIRGGQCKIKCVN